MCPVAVWKGGSDVRRWDPRAPQSRLCKACHPPLPTLSSLQDFRSQSNEVSPIKFPIK